MIPPETWHDWIVEVVMVAALIVVVWALLGLRG